MSTHPKYRQATYTETRCEEVLRVAEKNDQKRLLFLARHHLGSGGRQLPNITEINSDELNSLRDIAQTVLVRRVIPAMLALLLLSEITFPKDDNES